MNILLFFDKIFLLPAILFTIRLALLIRTDKVAKRGYLYYTPS
jgi:hypothetical protein